MTGDPAATAPTTRDWYSVAACRTALPVVPRTLAAQPSEPLEHVPDTAIEWADIDGLSIRGVSVRGHAHRYEGTIRQDQMALGQVEGSLIMAVADGVSQARAAHLGAAFAAHLAVARTAATVFLWDDTGAWDWAPLAEALADAAAGRGLLPGAVATTLTVAVIGPPCAPDGTPVWPVAVAQIGDSPCFRWRAGAWSALVDGLWRPVPLTDDACATSATAALPHDSTATLDQAAARPGDVLALATDGIGHLIADQPEFAAALGELWRDGAPNPADLLRLADTAVPTYDDDRTLLALRFDGGT